MYYNGIQFNITVVIPCKALYGISKCNQSIQFTLWSLKTESAIWFRYHEMLLILKLNSQSNYTPAIHAPEAQS